MEEPFALVWKSLENFKRNLLVLVPTIMLLGMWLVLALFAGLQALAATLFFDINAFTPGLAVYAAIFMIIDVAIALLMTAYANAAQYGVITDSVVKGKSSFPRLLRHGREYLGKMLTFTIAKFLVIYVPFVILALLAGLAYLASPAAGIMLSVIFLLLWLLFLIAFMTITVFNTPILFSRNIGGFEVILQSFRYGKENFSHVIITVAIAILLWIIMSFVSMVVGAPYYAIDFMMQFGVQVSAGLMTVYFISLLLSSVVSWIGGLIIAYFVFNSFFDKNPAKNWK